MKLKKKIIIAFLYLLKSTFIFSGSILNNNPSSENLGIPEINFYGTIETEELKKIDAEFILIDNKFEKIKFYNFYNKPILKKEDIEKSFSLINLKEIKSILFKSEIKIEDDSFYLLNIISKNNSEEIYLTNKNLTFYKLDRGPLNDKKAISEKRILSFSKIKKLDLLGFKYTKTEKDDQIVSKEFEKKSKISNKKNLNTIDFNPNIENKSKENLNLFEKTKINILSLLNSIKNKIQKTLNLLNNNFKKE